jgi:spore germination protein GerM
MSEEMDRKMRDLMARVVEMTPEAPPFPEETMTLSPAPARRSIRPMLVFATAAAAVLLVALPLLLLEGDGGVEPAVTTVPAPTTTPTAPETTAPDTTAPVEVSVPVTVYFFQSPGNSPTGGNPALVPVATLESAPAGSPELLAALRALLDPDVVPPPGLEDSIPADVAVLGVVEEGDMITVDMNQAFLAGSGTGLLGDITMLNQLIYTATQNDPVGVVFTVDGQEPGPYGTEGILLDTAFTRDYYRDELNSVIVTTPVGPESTEISGVANTFEATVSLR